jgi:hypothetical protein
MLVGLALVVAQLGAAGCGGSGGGGGSATIASTTLAGKVGGQAWSLGTGDTESALSTASTFFGQLYPDTFTVCTDSYNQNENMILVDVPMATGEYNLSLLNGGPTATFVVGGSQNNIASGGHLVVDSVTATTVTGGMNVTFDSNNTVDGQFSITICQ